MCSRLPQRPLIIIIMMGFPAIIAGPVRRRRCTATGRLAGRYHPCRALDVFVLFSTTRFF